jgi:hypothetical protein
MRTHMKKIKRLLAAAVWLLFAGGASRALSQDVNEYTVKAAYLYNFAKFVQWPDKAFGAKAMIFTIGILGTDPFGNLLEQAVDAKMVDGRSITIKRFDGFDDSKTGSIRKCQILFICYSEKDRLPQILNALQGASVLTVSEIERFPAKGGMILFDQEGDRITLAINPGPATKAGLTLSAKLLQVSKIYTGE